MKFFARVWTTVTTVTHWLILSPFEEYGVSQNSQQPIGGISYVPVEVPVPKPLSPPKQPLTTPPGSNLAGFECDYTTNMGPDWYDCTTEYTGCWIKNSVTGEVFDTTTDYEVYTPVGITRYYTLNVTDGNTINIDGMDFQEAKLFNKTFPGPLLEACWGDTISITVVNNMTWNGTSIHWHGIRQNQTMHMDGVNGITQCPVAPKHSFTYVWNATQYGSSWYHSHYSVQYADGLQGPITLHGPTTVDYDEAVTPLLTSDWLHNTAFDAEASGNLSYPTLLLNGTGNCERFYSGNVPPGCSSPPTGFVYNMTSISPSGNGTARYLFRIINTSYSTAIIFSIDNHTMQVIEADFVPTEPSQPVQNITVSIGQRYHVIVEALADPYAAEVNGNFWIRTNSSGCFDDIPQQNTGSTGFERTGILRYNHTSQEDPQSQAWPGNIPESSAQCIDDITMQLRPAYNWTVNAPKNNDGDGEAFAVNFTKDFSQVQFYNLSFVAFSPQQGADNRTYFPFQTTYGDPTFLNLDNDLGVWPESWMVIPENYTEDDFVYLALIGGGHPIHLHGHDFAVLNYSPNADWGQDSLSEIIQAAPYVNNTMRRDVILIPPNGYTVIAFKTDNPGAWLMHCHIAFHASGGLSLQIMERQSKANEIWPPGQSNALRAARQVCQGWNNWAYDCRNYWPGNQTYQEGNKTITYWPSCNNNVELQNDSGV